MLDLGYPEGDSLTIALERARVAALELACGDDGSSRKREQNTMDALRRAFGVDGGARRRNGRRCVFENVSFFFSSERFGVFLMRRRVPRATCAVRGGRVAGVAF